jgi:hypothetical protein
LVDGDRPGLGAKAPPHRPSLEGDRRARIVHVFNQLTVDTLHLLDDFYDERVEFHDPVTSFRGRDDLRRYYAGLYQFVDSISFEFEDVVEDGDSVVAVWVMRLRASGLRKGETIELPGTSHLRFDARSERVVYHRDYFDMGAFVYEHVPVLGSLVRLVNRKLRQHGDKLTAREIGDQP